MDKKDGSRYCWEDTSDSPVWQLFVTTPEQLAEHSDSSASQSSPSSLAQNLFFKSICKWIKLILSSHLTRHSQFDQALYPDTPQLCCHPVICNLKDPNRAPGLCAGSGLLPLLCQPAPSCLPDSHSGHLFSEASSDSRREHWLPTVESARSSCALISEYALNFLRTGLAWVSLISVHLHSTAPTQSGHLITMSLWMFIHSFERHWGFQAC